MKNAPKTKLEKLMADAARLRRQSEQLRRRLATLEEMILAAAAETKRTDRQHGTRKQ